MAVVTTKSGQITQRDATPRTLANGSIAGGFLREWVDTVEIANGDSIGSKYIMCSVPSNLRVSAVRYKCDAITSAAADIGIYRTTADGGAVVVAAAFGSAVSLASALSVPTDVTHEADPTDGNTNDMGLADVAKPLWQVLGLTADPKVMYDVVATLTAAATAAGTLSLSVQGAL
ncbi:MAG: hypothetical protein U1F35_05365 [Steroidobacteraceae bacterium]